MHGSICSNHRGSLSLQLWDTVVDTSFSSVFDKAKTKQSRFSDTKCRAIEAQDISKVLRCLVRWVTFPVPRNFVDVIVCENRRTALSHASHVILHCISRQNIFYQICESEAPICCLWSCSTRILMKFIKLPWHWTVLLLVLTLVFW
jgi:hypothetical protein